MDGRDKTRGPEESQEGGQGREGRGERERLVRGISCALLHGRPAYRPAYRSMGKFHCYLARIVLTGCGLPPAGASC